MKVEGQLDDLSEERGGRQGCTEKGTRGCEGREGGREKKSPGRGVVFVDRVFSV
jgi:hypothetical protein